MAWLSKKPESLKAAFYHSIVNRMLNAHFPLARSLSVKLKFLLSVAASADPPLLAFSVSPSLQSGPPSPTLSYLTIGLNSYGYFCKPGSTQRHVLSMFPELLVYNETSDCNSNNVTRRTKDDYSSLLPLDS